MEPFGEFRQDLRFAQLASHMANLKRNPKKRPQPFTADDFLNKNFGEFQESMDSATANGMSLDDQIMIAFRAMGMEDKDAEE